jgi:hypothetical protein
MRSSAEADVSSWLAVDHGAGVGRRVSLGLSVVTLRSARIASMSGCSGAALDEVVAADHGAIEQVAEHGSLVFSQCIDENDFSEPG